jgi:hypothetical protein
MFLTPPDIAWADTHDHGLLVDVKREGHLYTINARFNTTLTKCAAYHFLTDYEVAKKMPGVISLLEKRLSANKAIVDLTANEHVLFFNVRLHSVMEYSENPFESISFTQLSGDLKTFQGKWNIEPNGQGNTLKFSGQLERDTRMPMIIVDLFVKNSLLNKFSAIADLAEHHKDTQQNNCRGQN